MEHDLPELTSVETLKMSLSKGRFLIEFVGNEGLILSWFNDKTHLKTWERNQSTCCSLYLELQDE
jgi:hypothetical protein